MKCCKECKVWQDVQDGECHKHPPVVLPWISNSQGPYDNQPIAVTEYFATVWPEVRPDAWCGEFEPKETLAQKI